MDEEKGAPQNVLASRLLPGLAGLEKHSCAFEALPAILWMWVQQVPTQDGPGHDTDLIW